MFKIFFNENNTSMKKIKKLINIKNFKYIKYKFIKNECLKNKFIKNKFINNFIKKFKFIKNMLHNIKMEIDEECISEYAAEAAYFTIISLIPFFSFFISLIKLTNIEKENIFLILKNFIPLSLQNLIFNIIEESYLKSIKIMSFSLIVLFWSAGKGFFSLSKGLKKIYKVNIKSNFFQRILSSIYSLILIILMIIFIFIMILGKKIYVFFMKKFPEILYFIMFIYKFRTIGIIILLTIVFYFFYKIISFDTSKRYKHIYGAIFSAIMWQFSMNYISLYVTSKNIFTDFQGSLNSTILILLWMYISMYIILLGAKINTISIKRKY